MVRGVKTHFSELKEISDNLTYMTISKRLKRYYDQMFSDIAEMSLILDLLGRFQKNGHKSGAENVIDITFSLE